MSENREDILITFESHNDLWHWHLIKGKYAAGGTTNSLDKAEDKAFEVADQLPNAGVIQTKYIPGKPVEKPTMSFKEELDKIGFHSALNKVMNDSSTQEVLDRIGSDYDDQGVPYWEKSK